MRCLCRPVGGGPSPNVVVPGVGHANEVVAGVGCGSGFGGRAGRGSSGPGAGWRPGNGWWGTRRLQRPSCRASRSECGRRSGGGPGPGAKRLDRGHGIGEYKLSAGSVGGWVEYTAGQWYRTNVDPIHHGSPVEHLDDRPSPTDSVHTHPGQHTAATRAGRAVAAHGTADSPAPADPAVVHDPAPVAEPLTTGSPRPPRRAVVTRSLWPSGRNPAPTPTRRCLPAT